MADTKLTGLASLSAVPDDADYVYVVDVSDTSMAASGTSKKNLAKYYIRSNGTANTLGANIAANNFNFTGAGTVNATRIGLGTATPGFPIHVNATTGTHLALNTTSGDYTQISMLNVNVEKFLIGWNNALSTGYITSGGESLYFNASGLGVGTYGNGYKLQVNGSLQATQSGDAWSSLTFNTGWGNNGGGYQSCQYKKFGDLVFIRGVAKRSSGSSTTIGTLPSGYRPASAVVMATISNDVFGIVQINTTGDIVMVVGVATTYVSLDNICISVI